MMQIRSSLCGISMLLVAILVVAAAEDFAKTVCSKTAIFKRTGDVPIVAGDVSKTIQIEFECKSSRSKYVSPHGDKRPNVYYQFTRCKAQDKWILPNGKDEGRVTDGSDWYCMACDKYNAPALRKLADEKDACGSPDS